MAANVIRRKIGYKIFALCSGLLVAMLAISLYANHKTEVIRRRLDEIAEYQMVFSQQIAGIDTALLQQEINVEIIRRYKRSEPEESEKISRELSRFQENGEKVLAYVRVALELCNRAVREHTELSNHPEFPRLREFLEFVKQAQHSYQDLGMKIVKAADERDTAQLSRLMPQFQQMQDEYNRNVSRVRQRLYAISQAATLAAANAERELRVFTAALVTLSVLAGLIFAAVVTMGLVHPIQLLVSGTREVERGNLDVEVRVRCADEVHTLASAFNHLVVELRLKERIKETFGKYIDPRIVEDLIENPETIFAEGKRRMMSVCFTDIAGFTSLSENMPPDQLVHFMNFYLKMISLPIGRHSGVIDKFIGDAVMAFWGAPFTGEDNHAVPACYSALEQLEQVVRIRSEAKDAFPSLNAIERLAIRTGISTGELVVGNIGPDFSKSYTVMGDTVNLASRLESVNKEYGTRILISENTYTMAEHAIEAREIDSIQVVGKAVPVRIFELLGRKGEIDANQMELRECFHSALQVYRKRDWDTALRQFQQGAAIYPGDPPCLVFIERIQALRNQTLPDDWDGVWRMQHK